MPENVGGWSEERVATLRNLWSRGLSCSQIAARMGEGITRNSIIGKVHRLKLTRTEGHEVRLRVNGPKRIRKSKPPGYGVTVRSIRAIERERNKKIMLAGGATKTSAAYRRHLPHIGEMTKTELRAMLAAAIQNTAAMGEAA